MPEIANTPMGRLKTMCEVLTSAVEWDRRI